MTTVENNIELQYPINGLGANPNYGLTGNCSTAFESFNATGTYSLGPTFVNDVWNVGGNATEHLSWTVAVSQTFNKTVNATNTASWGWLGSPPGIDLAASNLPYSGCAFFMGGLTDNLIRRGRTDNGDCSATFSSECAAAIVNKTQDLALEIVNADTLESQASTTPLLPQVCLQVVQGLTSKGAVPSACSRFVGNNMTWSEGALSEINMQFVYTEITGPNTTIAETETCPVDSTTGDINLPKGSSLSLIGRSWQPLYSTNPNVSQYNEYVDMFYQNGTTWVYPIITVLFPPANTSKLGYASLNIHATSAEAFMTCARPTNISKGSKVPSALAAPTPLRKLPLSKGTKAGIAIGVILGVLLIGALIGSLLWQRRKKRATRARALEDENRLTEEKRAREDEEAQKELKTPMLDSDQVQRFEMDSRDRKPEIEGEQKYELEGSPVGELWGSRIDHEMEGTKSGRSLSLEQW